MWQSPKAKADKPSTRPPTPHRGWLLDDDLHAAAVCDDESDIELYSDITSDRSSSNGCHYVPYCSSPTQLSSSDSDSDDSSVGSESSPYCSTPTSLSISEAELLEYEAEVKPCNNCVSRAGCVVFRCGWCAIRHDLESDIDVSVHC